MKIYRISKSIKYYHGSYNPLPIKTILSSKNGNFMDSFNDDSHIKLEQFKPNNYLSRNNAVYMTDNPDDIDIAGGSTEFIYIVQPLGKIEKHDLNWMSEIDLIISEAIENNQQEDDETIEKVKNAAINYWNGTPHYNESLWEYLTPSAIIIKEIL